MPVVNGLHNSDVTFLIISSWVGKNGRLFRERVIPGIRTWMRMATNVLLLLKILSILDLHFVIVITMNMVV